MKKIIPFIVAAVLGGAAIVWFLVANKSAVNAPSAVDLGTPVADAQSGLGAQVFEQISQDPVGGNIPKSNPFEAGTNPYSDSYKNPFNQ